MFLCFSGLCRPGANSVPEDLVATAGHSPFGFNFHRLRWYKSLAKNLNPTQQEPRMLTIFHQLATLIVKFLVGFLASVIFDVIRQAQAGPPA